MECLTYCLYQWIDLAALEKLAKANVHYRCVKHIGVLEIYDKTSQSYLYVFTKGTLVGWHVNHQQLFKYFKLLDQAGHYKMPNPLFDSFSCEVGKETGLHPHESLNLDCVTLKEDVSELKLSFSYGFSQSIKLKAYESRLEKLIYRYRPLTKQLAEKGVIRLSQKQIRKIIGEITLVKEEINLASDLLYQPKFFWQHPGLEEYYTMIHDYLDIDQRTEMINNQLNTLSEIFMMFNSYLESKHSFNIELVITILIVIEIISSLIHINIHL